MDISTAGGAGAAGGTVAVFLVRLLLSSWLREQKARDVTVDKRFRALDEEIERRFAQISREFQEFRQERRDEVIRADTKHEMLMTEIRNLSTKVTFLNATLVAKGVLAPGAVTEGS